MTDTDGLANQGWKDSFDSIFHADGSAGRGADRAVRGPGLCVRGQAGAAEIARALGEEWARLSSARPRRCASASRICFWLDDLGCYALALDGRKQPCRVLSSNAGHALFAGIASPERAARLARLLTGKSFFSGWGVRTIAAGQARYNPMSYHNGSVWPHDNALIAMGLARYGHKNEVLQIFQGLAEAAVYDEFRRLPELFCGFSRRRKRGPTSYPVACSPQAWAAAAPFALVAAATGLDLDHASGGVRLVQPGAAPPFSTTSPARHPPGRRPARSAPVALGRRRHHRGDAARRQGRADNREVNGSEWGQLLSARRFPSSSAGV